MIKKILLLSIASFSIGISADELNSGDTAWNEPDHILIQPFFSFESVIATHAVTQLYGSKPIYFAS